MTDIVADTANALLLDVLPTDPAAPLPVTALLHAVRDRHGVRMPRPTAYSALNRLMARSLAAYVDDPDGGHPRRWFAVPRAMR